MSISSFPSATRSMVGLGVAMMLLGDLVFTANDGLGKWLAASYSPGEVLLARSLVALVVLAPFLGRKGFFQLTRLERPRIQALRVAAATGELVCFYTSVAVLPLADVMTFYLAAPLYVAAVSPWLLGERVSGRQWLAILAGLAGVLVAMRPASTSFGWPSLVALGAAFCYASMMIGSRILRGTPDRVLVFWQTVGALVLGLVAAPFSWVTPSPRDAALLATLGVVAMLAHIAIARSMKWAPAAVVAPAQYMLIVWAALIGWLFFGDVPTPPLIAGAVLIVVAGLWLLAESGRGGPDKGAVVFDGRHAER